MVEGKAEITVNVNFNTKGAMSLQPPGSSNSHMQKPTVGRIVHFWDTLDEPWAAIVVRVVSGMDVELVVYWPSNTIVNGFKYDAIHSYSETPKPGHWSWPPR